MAKEEEVDGWLAERAKSDSPQHLASLRVLYSRKTMSDCCIIHSSSSSASFGGQCSMEIAIERIICICITQLCSVRLFPLPTHVADSYIVVFVLSFQL